jgi:hypothetical protein
MSPLCPRPHLGAVGWVLDADAFGGGVFVASEYPVTVKAALFRLGLGGAPGDPEWDDLLLCSNTKSTQHRAPGKINTGITRTKRYCSAPDGMVVKMTVLAHGSPHAGQTGWQHLRHLRCPAMTGLLLTGRLGSNPIAGAIPAVIVSPLTCDNAGREGTVMAHAAPSRSKIPTKSPQSARGRAASQAKHGRTAAGGMLASGTGRAATRGGRPVTERLEADAPNMTLHGADLIAYYLPADRRGPRAAPPRVSVAGESVPWVDPGYGPGTR